MNILRKDENIRLACCTENGTIYFLPIYLCDTTDTKITYNHQMQSIIKYSYPETNAEWKKTTLYPYINHFMAEMASINGDLQPMFIYCSNDSSIKVFTSDLLESNDDSRYIVACIENGLVETIIRKLQKGDDTVLRKLHKFSENTIEIIKSSQVGEVIERLLAHDRALESLRYFVISLRER